MTPEAYQEALILIVQSARLVGMVDVPDMLQRIERADSLGALLDPTLYGEKHAAMMEDKQLLEAALPLYRIAKEMEARARERLRAAGGIE